MKLTLQLYYYYNLFYFFHCKIFLKYGKFYFIKLRFTFLGIMLVTKKTQIVIIADKYCEFRNSRKQKKNGWRSSVSNFTISGGNYLKKKSSCTSKHE